MYTLLLHGAVLFASIPSRSSSPALLLAGTRVLRVQIQERVPLDVAPRRRPRHRIAREHPPADRRAARVGVPSDLGLELILDRPLRTGGAPLAFAQIRPPIAADPHHVDLRIFVPVLADLIPRRDPLARIELRQR